MPTTGFTGYLTRLGDVTELLRARDDRFVIFGPGEEITLGFDARKLPELPAAPRVRCPTLGIWSSGDEFVGEAQMRGSGGYVDGPWRYDRLLRCSHRQRCRGWQSANHLLPGQRHTVPAGRDDGHGVGP